MDTRIFVVASEGPAVCTPGTGGMPGGLLGHLLCGDWHTNLPQAVADRWPWWTALAVAAVAGRVVWLVVRRRRWNRHAQQARWLELTPPTAVTFAATVQLWRLAATLLPAPSRWAMRPARLVWEVAAEPDRLRLGLWIPPGVHPGAVSAAVGRAWPGTRVEPAPPPDLPDGAGVVAGNRLVPTQPQWMPLVDDPPPATLRRPGGIVPPEEDRQRAVFDALAAAGRTGGAILQVHVSRAPRARVAMLRRATVNPTAQRRRGRWPALGLAIGVVRAVVGGLLDVATGDKTARGGADPYAAQLAAAAKTKLADPPFLVARVQTVAIAETRAQAKAAAEDITGGYGLVSAQLARARLWHPATAVATRWAPLSGMHLVNVAEAAVLAGLPAEPSAYGLPAAAARTRPPARDVWTPDHTTFDGGTS